MNQLLLYNYMRKIIITLFIVGSLFVNVNSVSACSCISPASPQESLEQSTAVFAGEVIDIDIPSGKVMSSSDPVTVTFDVSKTWKGPDYNTLVLTTSRDEASCGYSFTQNKEYIVYAYGDDNNLSTSICNRTKLLANAQNDVQELGEGNIPTESNPMPIQETTNYIQIISIIGGAIVIIVVAISLVRAYKK